MEEHNAWHSSVSGIKRLIPRWESGYAVLPVKPSSVRNVQLKIDGLALKVALNGVPLKRSGESYHVPAEILKPWENEVCLYGWPKAAWLVSDGDRLAPYTTVGKVVQSREQSDDPLIRAGDALCSFIVTEGPDTGDMFSFYDPVDETFRLPRWRWDTGICLEALSRLEQSRGGDRYREAIRILADRFLSVQLRHPECPGGFPEAADPHMAEGDDPVLPEWVVPFNGAFIGLGLIEAARLFNASESEKYNQAARNTHSLMITKGMTSAGLLRGYYHVNDQTWRYHGQINDSGIFTRLSNLLHREGADFDVDAVLRYAQAYSDFIQPEGYVGRAFFFRNQPEIKPTGRPLFPEWKDRPDQLPAKIFARGQAWAILGLVGAWQLRPDQGLGWKIRSVTDYLLNHKSADGCWAHDLRRPETGADIKGTAAITWALLEASSAYQASGGDGEKLKDAVQFAWGALRENQQKFIDGPLPGALLDEGEEGAIIYYRNRPMYTAYAAGGFILTGLLLEGSS